MPATGFWYRWFSRWREPEVVLLDHGLYVELPEQLRQVWQPATILSWIAISLCRP